MSNEKKRQSRILAASRRRRAEKAGRESEGDRITYLSDKEYKSVYHFEHPFNLSSAWLKENHPELPIDEAQKACGEKTRWAPDSH